MKIEIEVTLEDALAIKHWLQFQMEKEIMNEILPRNHILLFGTLINESIENQLKENLK